MSGIPLDDLSLGTKYRFCVKGRRPLHGYFAGFLLQGRGRPLVVRLLTVRKTFHIQTPAIRSVARG